MEEHILSDSDLKAKWDCEATIAYAAKIAKVEGKTEEKITVAAELKKLGISIQNISKVTKLTPEEIENIEIP